MKLQRCWVHVRRRYADIVKNLKEKDRTQSIAYQILSEIEKLFALEKNIKTKLHAFTNSETSKNGNERYYSKY
jgi:hypothetical protein